MQHIGYAEVVLEDGHIIFYDIDNLVHCNQIYMHTYSLSK